MSRKPKRGITETEEIVNILAEICMAEIQKPGVYSWYIENGRLIPIETSVYKVAAEFIHDSHDSRTSDYKQFRTDIQTEISSLLGVGNVPAGEYDEDQILLSKITKLGDLKTDGIMNFQIVRAPHDMRQEVAENLCQGAQDRGVERPACAPDRGVSKDLVSRLTGHSNEITTVGILYDNATAKPDNEQNDTSFFPADRNEFEQTGFVIGMQTEYGKRCICIRGYNYQQYGKNYRTYKGIIIENIGKKENRIEFDGISTSGNYFEPTIEKLAAEESYNGRGTGLSSVTRMLSKFAGDDGQRTMAGGAARRGIKCTLTTGDGNMFAFALDGIHFLDTGVSLRFPIVYAKMRSVQEPGQGILLRSGPQSLIISAWPDQGALTDEQVRINKRIKSSEKALSESSETDQQIVTDIGLIDDLVGRLQKFLEENSGKRIRSDDATRGIVDGFTVIKRLLYDRYTIDIPSIVVSNNFDAKNPIEQIYDILLKMDQDGSTRFAMIKRELENKLTDARRKADLIRQEIDEAKELFESYSKGVEQDEYEESIASSSAPSTLNPYGSQESAWSQSPFHTGNETEYKMPSYPYKGDLYSPNASPLPPPKDVFSQRMLFKPGKYGGKITKKNKSQEKRNKKSQKKLNKKSQMKRKTHKHK